MNSIGRFFAEEWQMALKNEGQFYTPIPTVDMTLEQLNQIKADLEYLIRYWENQTRPDVNTAWDAIANAQAIADLQTQKLQSVNSIIDLKTLQTNNNSVVVSPTQQQSEVTQAEAGTGSGLLLPLLLVAGGIWFLSRRKKRGGRRARYYRSHR